MTADAPPPASGRPKSTTRGFAGMTPARRKEISALGGRSIPAHMRSFAQNRDLASAAGAKGGAASKGGGRPHDSKNLHE